MAISPNYLLIKLQNECDVFEKYIDEELKNKRLDECNRIYIDLPSDFEICHYKILEKKYLLAGWTNFSLQENKKSKILFLQYEQLTKKDFNNY